MKRKDVGALWEFYNDKIFKAVRAVVFGELGAESPGLDADHRIELRVEIGGSCENLGGNLEFFNRSAGVIDGVFCQIAQQFAKRFRTMQGMAADEPVNLLEEKLPFDHRNPLIRRSNRSVTSHASPCKVKSYLM